MWMSATQAHVNTTAKTHTEVTPVAANRAILNVGQNVN